MNNNLSYRKYEDEIEELNQKIEYLEEYIQEIHSSLGWRIISRIRNNQTLYNITKPIRTHIKSFFKLHKNKQDSECLAYFQKSIVKIPENSVVAICHKDWMGVRYSTEALFKNVLLISDIYSKKEAVLIANLLCKKKIKKIVFSGFAEGYQLLIKQIKEINPLVEIMILWHGNTTHMYEDYSWNRHCEIISLYKEGLINKIGFVKKSMAELYRLIGVQSEFVMNYVPNDIMKLSKTINYYNSEDIKIGIYASGNTWNKNVYTQIAAAKFFEKAVVNAIPCNDRMKKFAKQIGVKLIGINNCISRTELLKHMKNNTINFYVTFSECAPLLPLESLNLGIPCITGPNHHYFDDHPLYDYLVVKKPDDSSEIAKKAMTAIEKRTEILRLYEEWYNENYQNAKKCLERFVGEINE